MVRKTIRKGPTAIMGKNLPSRDVFVRSLQNAGFRIRPGYDTWYDQSWSPYSFVVFIQTGEHAAAVVKALDGLEIGEKRLTIEIGHPDYQLRADRISAKPLATAKVPSHDKIRKAFSDKYDAFLKEEKDDDEDEDEIASLTEDEDEDEDDEDEDEDEDEVDEEENAGETASLAEDEDDDEEEDGDEDEDESEEEKTAQKRAR